MKNLLPLLHGSRRDSQSANCLTLVQRSVLVLTCLKIPLFIGHDLTLNLKSVLYIFYRSFALFLLVA